MPNRVNMKTVAEEVGVSVSTVSRALKNDSRISEGKRKLIQQAAVRLGYKPNPMVSALMLNRRQHSRKSVMNTIALITDYQGGTSWKEKDVCRWEYAGIKKRADELGFIIEEFALADYGGDIQKLETVLKNRGVHAMNLGFSRARKLKMQIPSDDFVVAGLSAYFPETVLDRSNFHGLYNVRLALDEMRKLGYKKTGLVVPDFNNKMSGHLWSAGVLDWQRNLSVEERCEPFIPLADSSALEFQAWLKRETPDSLLVYKLPVKSWLARMGLRIPEDIGVAYLFRTHDEIQEAAGIDGNLQTVGEAALDLVVGGLVTNRKGLPDHPKEVLIKGSWVMGNSLMLQSSALKK